MGRITCSAGINLASSHLYGSGDRLGSQFVMIFSFYKPICQKKILFHLEALNGHQESSSCTGSPLLFFPPDKSGGQGCTFFPLLSSLSAAAAVSSPLGAHQDTTPMACELWWHGKAQFCRHQHDYGEGEGEVEQMCFNISFFVFITVP